MHTFARRDERAPTTPKETVAESAFPGLTPDAPFRAAEPPPEPHKTWQPPKLFTSRLANGMQLIVLERRQPPLVAAELVVRGGFAGHPQASPTAISLATAASMHGTGKLREQDVWNKLNSLYAELNVYATDDGIRTRIRAASDSFDGALELLRDVTVDPSMDQRTLDFQRQRRLALAPKEADDVSLVAQRVLYEAVYGPAHPCARARQPEAAELPLLTRDDLLRTWKRVVDPSETTLIVAGDVDAHRLSVRVEQLFGGWQHDAAHEPAQTPPAPAPETPRILVVDRPVAPQAMILYGTTTSPSSGPTHWAEVVAWQLLGWISSSKLTQMLRNDLGATAFGGSTLVKHRGAGIAYWQGSVDRDKAVDVLSTIAKRVADLRARGPDAQELEDAKESVARAPERGFETVMGMHDHIAVIPLLGFPLDDLTTREARIEALSADDIRSAVAAPESMKAVVVGDMSVLRPKLQALGWGVIEDRSPTGQKLGAP